MWYIALEILGDLPDNRRTYKALIDTWLARFGGRYVGMDIWSVKGQDAWLLKFESSHPQIFQLLQDALQSDDIFSYRIAQSSISKHQEDV